MRSSRFIHRLAVAAWLLAAMCLAAPSLPAAPPSPDGKQPTPASPEGSTRAPGPAAAPAAAQADAAATSSTAAKQSPQKGSPKKDDASNQGPAAPADAPATDGVHEVGPEVYYLPDEQGKLRPVLGWTLDDFRGLIRQSGHDPAPRYILNRLVATGTATADRAHVNVEVTVTLHGQKPGDWVRVPLKLSGAILQQPAEVVGGGRLFLEYQEGGDGYVAWLRGEADTPQQIDLDMLLPLKAVGGERELDWKLPRVAPSQLKLFIPLPEVESDVSEGSTLLPPVAQHGGTELTVLGLSGDFRLNWRPPDQRLSSRSRLLEAEGAQWVRIDRGQIHTQAQLKVRSLGSEFDRFRVKLPAGARLVSEGQTGYTVAPVEQQAARRGVPPSAIVEVRLEKKTRGPVDIRLVCQQTYDLNRPRDVALGGFEVEGAVRQWGNIAVQVTGDWHLLWGATTNVRRVDVLPDPLPNDNLAAGFEYFAQPVNLSARITPPTTRVSVEPEYVVDVASDGSGGARLQLSGKLKYLVSGAKVFDLAIDLNGWELDEGGLGPAGRIDLGNLVSAVKGPMKIPLSAAQKGEFEITLKAHRLLRGATQGLSFGLPRPLVDNLGTTTLVIVPQDNVQLTPQRDAMVGLVPLPVVPSIELPPRQQMPFYYRSDQSDARYVADFQVHAREITADVVSHVRLSERTAEVRQALDFDVAFEPVESLSLDVPRELATAGVAKISLEDQTLVPIRGRETDPGHGATPTVRLRLPLRKPRIGRLSVRIQYQVDLEKLSPGASVPVSVPLAMPAEAQLRHNRLIIEPLSGITVEPAPEDWSPSDDARREASDTVGERYVARSATAVASLLVAVQQRPNTGAVVIRRGWLQSWFTANGRQDQAAYLLTSRDDVLTIALPDGADPTAAEVWLDGQSVPESIDANGSLLIHLPRPARNEHRLVLRYLVAESPGGWPLRASTPRFPEGTWVQKMYWQLALSGDEYLLTAPAGTTPEFTWQRHLLSFNRQPLLSDAELGDWLGAGPLDGSAPSAAHRYLLSITSTGGTYVLPLATRSAMVLFSSGGVLLCGLLLIYLPWLRRPAVLLSAAIVLLTIGLLYPEPALLMAQAATLGLGLVILMGVLRRLLSTGDWRPVALGPFALPTVRPATIGLHTQPGPVSPSSSTVTKAMPNLPEPAPASASQKPSVATD